MPEFPIIEILPDWLLGEEQMGSKSKRWVQLPDDDQLWLFKYSRESAGLVTGEHWAEKLGAEVACQLGVPHARVELARLEGAWGALSRRFDALSRDDTELVHGNDILAGYVTGYDRQKQRKQSDHTLSNVIRAIGSLFADEDARAAALRTLAGYLILDALILNTDRHHENWAVLRRLDPAVGVHYEIAPTFDHASSLGRNEPVDRLGLWNVEPQRIAWYARRGTGGVFWSKGDKNGANPLQLPIDAARHWPAYFKPWRLALKGMSATKLTDAVDNVPAEAMSMEAKKFSKALLIHTLDQLSEMI